MIGWTAPLNSISAPRGSLSSTLLNESRPWASLSLTVVRHADCSGSGENIFQIHTVDAQGDAAIRRKPAATVRHTFGLAPVMITRQS